MTGTDSAIRNRIRGHSYPAQAANPLTCGISWRAAYWADDPLWTNPGNGGSVASLRDGSGNGYTLAATGTAQPTFRSAVTNLNGKAGIEFDGTSDALRLNTPVLTQSYSVVLVAEVLATSGTPIFSDSYGAGRSALFINAGATWSAFAGSSVLSGGAPSTGKHAFRMLANNASSAINVDGSNTTGTLGTSTGFTGITLGAFNGGASNWANFRLGFWGVYQGDITAATAWPVLKGVLYGHYGATLG